MAFEYGIVIEEKKLYTSFERIYADKFGRVCEEDSPNVASLLVGQGCQIPWADAVAAGLVSDEDAGIVVETETGGDVVTEEEDVGIVVETETFKQRGRPKKEKS